MKIMDYSILADATSRVLEISNQVNEIAQRNFKSHQENILKSIAEYLAEYTKPLNKVKKELTEFRYEKPLIFVNLCFCFYSLKPFDNSDYECCARFTVSNYSGCLDIDYFYDSDEVIINNNSSNQLFDLFLNNWEDIKKEMDEFVEFSLMSIQRKSLNKLKENQVCAELYNNFKI